MDRVYEYPQLANLKRVIPIGQSKSVDATTISLVATEVYSNEQSLLSINIVVLNGTMSMIKKINMS